MDYNTIESIHLIVVLVGLVVGFAMIMSSLIDDDDTMFGIGFIALVIGVCLFIFYAVGKNKCEKSSWEYEEQPYSVEKITAISDNNMMNGRFYLRSGYIESDLYYQYIVKSGNGGFRTSKVKSNEATIFYDEDNFRVEWYSRSKHWWYFEETDTYCEIYIPEGSLADSYSIDLK